MNLKATACAPCVPAVKNASSGFRPTFAPGPPTPCRPGANNKHDNMPQDSGARLNAKRKATLKIAKRAAAAEAAGKGRAEGTTGRKKADKKKS